MHCVGLTVSAASCRRSIAGCRLSVKLQL